jgi:hypothetical protein
MRVVNNKVSDMVVDPVSRIVQVTFGYCPVTIRSCKFELHWFYIPAMNMLRIAYSATKSLGGFAKVEPKEQAIFPQWKLEVNLSIDFKPPGLLEISNCLKPTQINNTTH